MKWIVSGIDDKRADVETYQQFIDRNLSWWKENESAERARRQAYYVNFIKRTNLTDVFNDSLTLAEVGCGPFGGIIEVCGVRALRKVFIDYALVHLVTLGFIKWPHDATYVHASAESIPLADSSVDVMLSYNAIDHGWDVFKALDECVRVSRSCYVAFDCRGDSSGEVERRKRMNDMDHRQMIRLEDVKQRVAGYAALGYDCGVFDLGNKATWPVAAVVVKKPVLVNTQVPAGGIETLPSDITCQSDDSTGPMTQGE